MPGREPYPAARRRAGRTGRDVVARLALMLPAAGGAARRAAVVGAPRRRGARRAAADRVLGGSGLVGVGEHARLDGLLVGVYREFVLKTGLAAGAGRPGVRLGRHAAC